MREVDQYAATRCGPGTLRDPLDRIVSNFMHTRYRAKMHPDQIGAQTSRHNSMNVSADDVMACVFPGAHCYHRRFFIEVCPAPCARARALSLWPAPPTPSAAQL